jgi:hypothetical protein
MGIFDFLTDTSKKIYRGEFNQVLNKIPNLSKEERDYLNEVFANDLADGLTEYELRQKIGQLQYKTDDPLDPYEVEQVKKKLLEKLEE